MHKNLENEQCYQIWLARWVTFKYLSSINDPSMIYLPLPHLSPLPVQLIINSFILRMDMN